MGAAAVKSLFATQKKFIDSLIRIPIPLMSNVDRSRLEHTPEGKTIERSMRQWAEGLYDAKGNSMQCDVENGGKDRNAYLLTPRHHSEAVKAAYRAYRERVHPFKQREERFHAGLEEAGTPTSIYVPTQSVRANISFLQSCTSAEHWKQAPKTVKNPAEVSQTQTQSRVQTQTQSQTQQNHLPDDITVATSTSSNSATTRQSSLQSEFDSRFAQLEASMNAQSEVMRQSAEAATSRFSHLESQMLKAMSHSSNALDSVAKLNEKVDRLTDMMTQVTSFLGSIPTNQPVPVPAQHQRQASAPDDASTATNNSEALYMKSPAKKKSKATTTAPSGDQYKDPSSEAGGEEC